MKRIPLVLAAAMVAGACSVGSDGSGSGSIGQQLGLGTISPDEFLIIANNPLQMPPSMNLPRPQPGAPSRVAIDPFSEAHASLFRRPGPIRLGTASTGEEVLLSGANAEGDNSVIRTVLAEPESASGERRFGMSTFFGIPIPENLGESDEVVQPVAETNLLRRQGFLTPAAPDGLEDEDNATGTLFTTRGVPTDEEIAAEINSGG